MLPILIIYLCYYVTGISAEFDMDEELAKIKKLCLTVEDHYEIAGKRVNEARVVYHYTFFNVAVDIIGLTEMRKVLGLQPPGPWTEYKYVTTEKLAAASTLEEYFELKTFSYSLSAERSFESILHTEKDYPRIIKFLDRKFPGIRLIFKKNFEKIMRDHKGEIDRKTIDLFISEYLQKILPKLMDATHEMYGTGECMEQKPSDSDFTTILKIIRNTQIRPK